MDDAKRHELAALQCPLCPVFWGPQNAQIIVAQSAGSCPLRVDRHLPSLPLRLILRVLLVRLDVRRNAFPSISKLVQQEFTRCRSPSVIRMTFEGRSKNSPRNDVSEVSSARATSICRAPRTMRQILTSEPIITCAAIHTGNLSGFLGSLSGFCRRAVQFSRARIPVFEVAIMPDTWHCFCTDKLAYAKKIFNKMTLTT